MSRCCLLICTLTYFVSLSLSATSLYDFYKITRQESFRRFLCWTDEKEKISQAIKDVIKTDNGSLLDIGAGDGSISKLLEFSFEKIVAVEPCESLFKVLENNCNSEKYLLGNTSFEEFVMDQKFDVVVASHSFQYISNPDIEIKRIRDFLKDDGLFLLINLRKECGYWRLYNGYYADMLGEPPKCSYNFDYDVVSFLEENGFIVKKNYFDVTVNVPSVDDLLSLFNFFYNVEFSAIKEDAFKKIRMNLSKEYGDKGLTIDFENVIYICEKIKQ